MEVERPYSLGTRWICSMLDAPTENRWVNIADGKVESVSGKPVYAATRHLGERSILLPATVNAHTHLELSQLTSPLDVASRSMSDWVVALLAFRRSIAYSVDQGIQQAFHRPELLESTIAVADIVPMEAVDGRQQTAGASRHWQNTGHVAEGESPFASSFHIPPASFFHHLPFTELIAWREELVPDSITPMFGLSPHAPHTVCQALLERAIAQNVPIAMHLAETKEELQLLRYHTGPLLEMMRRADPNYDPKSVLVGKRPMDYLQLLAAAPSVLIIHGNYLDDEELQFLASHRETMSVVYCPRSHVYFQHSPYPLKKMLDYGVRVLLGTDSLASVPDLSLVEEIRLVLKQHPAVLPEIIYRMGTWEGASALHLLQERFGSIQPGSPARFAVL